MNTDWIQTKSGKIMSLSDPNPDSVEICDIAYSLANAARWCGHAVPSISVAEHCCHTYDLARRGDQIYALLHDSHEAYTGDITGPMKSVIGRDIVNTIQRALDDAIYIGLGIEYPDSATKERIKNIDSILLASEFHVLMAECSNLNFRSWVNEHKLGFTTSFPCWSAELAYENFLTRFYEEQERTSDD